MSDGRMSWPAGPSEAEKKWIEGVLDGSDKPFNALDPLCGGGAVLYECGLRGWKCTGMEADPFLRWIATARSYRFRSNAPEFSGYAWERVIDDIFWESELFTVPEVPGTLEFTSCQEDFLRRARRQIDKETDEGINTLLRLAVCNALQGIHDAGSFDDTVGLKIIADSLGEVRDGVSPDPELSQTVHLCDSRNIPCTLRNQYDLTVSVLPSLNQIGDPVIRRTMSQWIGFGDMRRRDEQSVAYPLGGFDEYMSGYVPRDGTGIADMVPDTGSDTDRNYVIRWFEGIRDLLESLSHVISRKGRAFMLVPDEVRNGAVVQRAEVITQMASSIGLECEKEGTGAARCVVFARRQ